MVPVSSITGNRDEEMVTFGETPEVARNHAEQLLISSYGCTSAEVLNLLQQAQIQSLGQWCSSA
ncbi:MAG: hypothetical protein WCA35_09510 [Kovacikia sp.]